MDRSGTTGRYKRAVCTIVSKNYLPFARTFARSYREHNPAEEVYVLLVDSVDGYFDPAAEPFTLVGLAELGIEGIVEMSFKYSVVELNTAAKPFFLDYLFRRHGLERLIYFDPDIMVFSPLDELWALLDGHTMVLTPHLTSPIEDDREPGELVFLLAGVYNLGFIALRFGPECARFLDWWGRRLREFCYMDVYKGYHVDQKWVELAPGMHDGVLVHRDPGCNAAYWNLHDRRVEQGPGGYTVNGRPLRFFHFSGFNPDDIEAVSKYQDRHTLASREDIRPLFAAYRDLVTGNGYRETKGWPYAFASFDNGVPIPEPARKLYGYMPKADAAAFGDPFKTAGEGSFYGWLAERVGKDEFGHGITRLWREVYRRRVDAMLEYPEPLGRDWPLFVQWCLDLAEAEGGIPDELLPVAEDRMAASRINELAAEKESLAAWAGELRANNEAMAGHLAGLEGRIKAMQSSLSWRFTRPLRWLGERLSGGRG